jgi:hypothetical protein
MPEQRNPLLLTQLTRKLQESLPDIFEQLKGSPCQSMLQDSSSSSMPALGIELLLRCHICAK